MAKATPLNTSELLERLSVKYGGEEWAFFEQVRTGTGFLRRPRTADAIAMNLWPSRGLDLIGFEVKASRGDWRRELANPAKADELVGFCDRWYVVANKTVVQEGELPSKWGLMVPHGRGLRILTAAPKLEPQPVDKLFLASLLRKAKMYTIPEERLKAACDASYKSGIERGEARKESEMGYEMNRLKERAEGWESFKKQTGVDLRGFNAERYAKAMKVLINRETLAWQTSVLENNLQTLDKVRQHEERALEALKELQKGDEDGGRGS